MKRSILLSMLVMLGLSLQAQHITEQQARARVLNYLKSDNNARSRGMDSRIIQALLQFL